jgi:hypothetical protein
MNIRATSRAVSAFVLAVALAGCSSKTHSPGGPDLVKENLTNLFKAYQLAERELRRPPRDAKELKPFLEKVNSSEAALESPGDKQPFVVIWGANTGGKGMMADRKPDANPNEPQYPPILAYEKVGTPTGRHVLFVMGPQTILDEKRFREATFANNHKPSP